MGSNNRKIGLALSGGGPRGLAHIGVIKALQENRIPIDIIAGTSVGALIGGLFAALGSVAEVEKVMTSITRKDLKLILSDLGFYSGLIRGKSLVKLLRRHIKTRTIESLSLPFCALATNIETGDPVMIKKGDLAEAIKASSAIPIIFYPHRDEEMYLIDGGCSCPVPVEPARDLGATLVIAVNLYARNLHKVSPGSRPSKLKLIDVGSTTVELFQYNLAKQACKNADLTIAPETRNISSLDLRQFVWGAPAAIIDKGYRAALDKIEQIKKLIT